jgi:hypothetical protein
MRQSYNPMFESLFKTALNGQFKKLAGLLQKYVKNEQGKMVLNGEHSKTPAFRPCVARLLERFEDELVEVRVMKGKTKDGRLVETISLLAYINGNAAVVQITKVGHRITYKAFVNAQKVA